MSKHPVPKTVCVVGLGYIGLPTASMFATNGYRVSGSPVRSVHVHGVDINSKIIERLKQGIVHIKEPGLETVVKAAITSGNLDIGVKPVPSDVFIIAVPTPHNEEPGQAPTADLSFVKSAMESILPVLKKGNLVILESTSPPGTTEKMIIPMIKAAGFEPGKDVGVAYCPERVIPGKTMKELISNDRIIGAISESWGEMAKQLYRSFVSGEIFLTDPTTAEMVKLVENTYRDVNIAFANEMAMLCEKLKISVWDVVKMANRHPRVNIHNPGPGVGGHCISVDPWFLVGDFPNDTPLVRTARETNDRMPGNVTAIIKELLGSKTSGKIAILGIAYKANVDDKRQSPAIAVIEKLQKACPSFELAVHDPHVPHEFYPTLETDLDKVLKDADLAVILTGHDAYRNLDPNEAGALMRTRVVFDTHNVLKAERWVPAGFKLKTLGDGGQSAKKVKAG
jgi:UDP-N-acetyl-D-mannosaminuronic acid dehydrogenase